MDGVASDPSDDWSEADGEYGEWSELSKSSGRFALLDFLLMGSATFRHNGFTRFK